jgi:hypothetical protein
LQLDRVPPPNPASQLRGTTATPSGVWNGEGLAPRWGRFAAIARVRLSLGASRRRSWRGFALVLATVSLLGQGERYQLDPRFGSPTATLLTYWEAVQLEDLTAVPECFVEPTTAVPYPGMVWHIPPVRRLGLYRVRCEVAGEGRVRATYEVRFTASDALDEQHYVVESRLVRVRGAWRIEEAFADMATTDVMPVRRVVDI